jgi:putative endonuclease
MEGNVGDPRHGLGRFGEKMAAVELSRRGYIIRECNWRCPEGEMDIIAEHEGWLVFVEVRTRRGRRLGSPEESITSAKGATLIRVAQSYLAQMDWPEIDWRIDVVAIELTRAGKLARFDVYENAVLG